MGVIVRSEKYKGLIVGDLGVRFVDGELDVDDPKVLDRLRGLTALGVVVPDAAPSGRRSGARSSTKAGQGVKTKESGPTGEGDGAKTPEGAEPKGNASRDEWAAYAEHLGVTVSNDAGREAIKDLIQEAVADEAPDSEAETTSTEARDDAGDNDAGDDVTASGSDAGHDAAAADSATAW
jgi:hypothetical protein